MINRCQVNNKSIQEKSIYFEVKNVILYYDIYTGRKGSFYEIALYELNLAVFNLLVRGIQLARIKISMSPLYICTVIHLLAIVYS